MSEQVEIEFIEHIPSSSTGMKVLRAFELNATKQGSGEKVTQFNSDMTITISNTPEELAGLDIDSLHLYYLDEASREWVPVPDSHYNPENNTLTATTNHFTYFGEQANPVINGPGIVLAGQVDLHSGAAIFNYPIELPPGPGGFQPKLALVYNSGIADEMKNKRAAGSWVGIGWTLNLGKISYFEDTGRYYLEFNNASYDLFPESGSNYRVIPDQYFKVTRSGNTWEMLDRYGNYYRFGGTSDSQQYYDTSHYYCWNLNIIRDTNSNEATISYVQDIHNNSVRSAYPEYLKYNDNLVEVHFNSSYDASGDDGPLRNDNPVSYGVNPAPKVIENRKLNNIEIKVNSTLVKKYAFTYATTASEYSAQYGGIYYSGKHTLSSITQIGANGSSELPEITFTYQDLQTYLNDTIESDYSGNPGNPASFNWPHLTEIDNGYGGSISFSYTQIPSTSTPNIWTREAVTTKTIDSGIGTSQTYTYAYTGNPQYYGPKWNSQYRGFNEVKETDAQGNYIKHYFYTTGWINGNDAEKLTGKEYKTEWYNSSDTKLKEEIYYWSWVVTSQNTSCQYISTFSDGGNLYGPQGISAPNNGYVYVADNNAYNHRIVVFTTSGSYVTAFGSSYLQGPQDVAVSKSGYLYVADMDSYNHRIVVFDVKGNYIESFGSSNLYGPRGVEVSNDGYVYVADYDDNNHSIRVFDTDGEYVTSFGSSNLCAPQGISVANDGYIYVADNNAYNHRIVVFDASRSYSSTFGSSDLSGPQSVVVSGDWYVYAADDGPDHIDIFETDGSHISSFSSGYLSGPQGIDVPGDRYAYVADSSDHVIKYDAVRLFWRVQLDKVEEKRGGETYQVDYEYDNYGNIKTEHNHGFTSATNRFTIHRVFYPNTTANILSKPARERVYNGLIESDEGGDNLKKETIYYYDGNNSSYTTSPTEGNLTRLEQKKDASNSVSSYFTYDTYGNNLTGQDPNGETTTWTYETTYNTYPDTMTYPAVGEEDPLSESYTYDAGTNNLLSKTDVNGQTTDYEYDTFKRLTKVIKPGDSSSYPTIEYSYNDWGTLYDQSLETRNRISGEDYLWQSEYFDGLGRVIQVQSQGETGRTIVSSTATFNSRGLTDKQYVSQNLDSAEVNGYEEPGENWKYTAYTYDALGRISIQTNADGTTISHDYISNWWQDLVTNERGYKKNYAYDPLGRLIKVEEKNASHGAYAETEYSYDALGNLVQAKDDSNNTTTMTYDWLSRKTAMSDPDMGSWSYGYDSNGNLTSQTDARSQTISFTYDAMNRLTGKTYPQGSGMTDVTYTYDSTDGGNYGKGKRTGMTDALGTTSYKYDARGRLIQEKRTVDSVDYTTSFTYDGLDRIVTITYPTGEVVTNNYNGQGIPYSVSGSTAGDLVTSTLYNQLGQIKEINLGNSLITTFGYWGVGGTYDTTGDYYGRLWEIKTAKNWLSGWDNRIEITIDHSNIDSNLTHFPVLIHLSSSCGQSSQDVTSVFDEVGANYKKIAVTTGDGVTQLYVEVEKWDDTNEEAWLWISKDGWQVSGTQDTTLYLYYDNDHSDNTDYVGDPGSTPAKNVWDSNFLLVDHMADNPDSSYTLDSTSNANVGTKKGSAEPSEAAGVIYKKQTFDGTDDKISYGSPASLDNITTFTREAYAATDGGADRCLISKSYLKELRTTTLGRIILQMKTVSDGYFNTITSNSVFTANEPFYVGCTYDDAGDRKGRIYVNGAEVTYSDQPAVTGTLEDDSGQNIQAGAERTYDYLNGSLDEIRISDVVRSTAWLKATYHTLLDNILSYSDIEVAWLSGWNNRIKVTIDHTNIDSNLSHFPVLIHLSDSCGQSSQDVTGVFDEVGANYKKIAVTTGDGVTQLYVEVEKWDNTNEEAWLWVSKSGWQLSSTQDTTFYLYYDNDHSDNTDYVGDPGSTPAKSVWDSSFLLVDHMADNPDSSYTLDSTANANVGAKKGSAEPSEAAGVIHKKQTFDGTDDKISYGSPASLDNVTTFTREAYATSDGGADRCLISKSYLKELRTTTYGRIILQLKTVSDGYFNTFSSNNAFTANEAFYVGCTYDDAGDRKCRIYVNGAEVSYSSQPAVTGTLEDDSGQNMQAGAERTYDYLNGSLDEIRISDVVRSTAWLKATYHTLNDSMLTYSDSETYTVIQDVKHTWDAGGNLAAREDVLASQTETFTYDFLDRLTAVSGPYSHSYAYNQIGNITSMNGTSYTYSTQPHAVTSVGETDYEYDSNGNMTTRDDQTITWDVENRPISVTGGASFVYDGDGNRGKKTENSETILYINKYYEKNLTTSEITTHYYLGNKEIAQRKGTTLSYIHQDSLNSTSVTSSSNGTQTSSVTFYAFGSQRSSSGTIPTDKRFTGQRLDSTGLYFYNARYYDAEIGRFISPDTLVPDPANPQSLNRYSYCYSNPLRYNDPTGHFPPAAIAIAAAVANWETIIAIAGAMGALCIYYNSNANEWIRDRINDIPDFGTPTPNEFNWNSGKGSRNLGPIAKAVFVATAVAKLAQELIGRSEDSPPQPQSYESESGLLAPPSPVANKTPEPASPRNIIIRSTLTRFTTASSVELDRSAYPVGSLEYRAAIDTAYNTVASTLGAGQVVGWSSDLGYHAVDYGSYACYDYWY